LRLVSCRRAAGKMVYFVEVGREPRAPEVRGEGVNGGKGEGCGVKEAQH
jgi:hypothetical protein